MVGFVFIFLVLSQSFAAQALKKDPLAGGPLFTDMQIDQFASQVKQTQKIPALAVDRLFSFYKNNRASVGGLKDASCFEEKGFKIRWQDGKMTKEYLRKGIENESCLCVMDYTQHKDQDRGHCIFLEKDKSPQIESFLVAHGQGSIEVDGKPTTFTNSLKSTGTTLTGLFITAQNTYKFQGEKLGKYQSTGLGLYGVEKRNWTAASVGKVSHGAPYVIDDPAKKSVTGSLGCPAMPMEKAKVILPRCKGKAAWLNYTEEIKTQTDLTPQSCKPSSAKI